MDQEIYKKAKIIESKMIFCSSAAERLGAAGGPLMVKEGLVTSSFTYDDTVHLKPSGTDKIYTEEIPGFGEFVKNINAQVREFFIFAEQKLQKEFDKL